MNMDDYFTKTFSSRGWHRERVNPLDFVRANGGLAANITYDPKLRKGDYSIIRTQSTDGTVALSTMQFAEIMNLLIGRCSYQKSNPPDLSKLRDIHYTVGPMRIATVYGHVKLACSETKSYPGQRERYRMAVKVKYLY